MIDIAAKKTTLREATVEGMVFVDPNVIGRIKNGKIPKGDVLGAAKLAGILAAKKTPDLLPLCHPIPIEYINVEFFMRNNQIRIKTVVKGRAKTGVEMEAFTATAVAALTIYDMCKSLDRGAVISEIKLLKKSGGKSGRYERK